MARKDSKKFTADPYAYPTKAAQEHVVDRNNPNLTGINLHAVHVKYDTKGVPMTQMALINQDFGAEAFNTPTGGVGVGHFNEEQIDAMIKASNGLNYTKTNPDGSKDVYLYVATKNEDPTKPSVTPVMEFGKSKDGKSFGRVVAMLPTLEQIHPIANNVKPNLIQREGLVDDKGNFDSSKIEDGVKAQFRRIATMEVGAEVTKKAPAKEAPAKEAAAKKEPAKEAAAKKEPAKEAPAQKLEHSEAWNELMASDKQVNLTIHEMKDTGSLTALNRDSKEYVNGLKVFELRELMDAPQGVTLSSPEGAERPDAYTHVGIKGGEIVPSRTKESSYENSAKAWDKTVTATREAREALKADMEAALAEANGAEAADVEAEGPELG